MYFTDNEHRILLSAMFREKVVCKKVEEELSTESCTKSLTKICESIEKKIYTIQHKLAWHDLRKNPKDLPPNGYYDTWSYWHERYQNVRAFYNENKNKWLFHPDNNTGEPWIEGLSIIAWKEIDRFKENE